MEEIWKDIPNYEGLYQISNYGNIKNIKLNKNKKQTKNNYNGYLYVRLSKNNRTKTYLVHRLVAKVFLENYKDDFVVNHKDFNKENNACFNLEWCIQKENVNYSYNNGRMPLPPKQQPYKIKRNDGIIYNSIKEAGKLMNINPSMICNQLKGRQKTVRGYFFKYVKEE